MTASNRFGNIDQIAVYGYRLRINYRYCNRIAGYTVIIEYKSVLRHAYHRILRGICNPSYYMEIILPIVEALNKTAYLNERTRKKCQHIPRFASDNSIRHNIGKDTAAEIVFMIIGKPYYSCFYMSRFKLRNGNHTAVRSDIAAANHS